MSEYTDNSWVDWPGFNLTLCCTGQLIWLFDAWICKHTYKGLEYLENKIKEGEFSLKKKNSNYSLFEGDCAHCKKSQ